MHRPSKRLLGLAGVLLVLALGGLLLHLLRDEERPSAPDDRRAGGPPAVPALTGSPGRPTALHEIDVRVTGHGRKAGTPLHGATVALVRPASPSNPTRSVFETKTDPEGVARLKDVPPGTFDLIALAERHVGSRRQLVVVDGPQAQRVDVELTELARLTGRVLSSDRTPAVGASVHLLVPAEGNVDGGLLLPRDRDPSRTTDQRTSEEGRFEIAVVPPSFPLRLLARHDSGAADVALEKALAPGESREIEVLLTAPTNLRGVAPKPPVPGGRSTVQAWSRGSDGFTFTAEASASVAEDGSWLIRNLRAGDKEVTLVERQGEQIALAHARVSAIESTTVDVAELRPDMTSDLYLELEIEGGAPPAATLDLRVNAVTDTPRLAVVHYDVRAELTAQTRIVGLPAGRIQLGATLLTPDLRGPSPDFRSAFVEVPFDGHLGTAKLLIRRRTPDEGGRLTATLAPPPGIARDDVDSLAYVVDRDERVVLSHPGLSRGVTEHKFSPLAPGTYQLVVVANGFLFESGVEIGPADSKTVDVTQWSRNSSRRVVIERAGQPIPGILWEISAAGPDERIPSVVARGETDRHGGIDLPNLPRLRDVELALSPAGDYPALRFPISRVRSPIELRDRDR